MYRRIRDLREDHDLIQKDLAEYLNCSQVCYSQYERGNRDLPTDVLIKLAEFYNTSIDYLLGVTDTDKPYPKAKRKKRGDGMQFDNIAVGRTIRKLRKQKDLSQEVLSGLAGIARTHLTMIESGSKQANFETIWRIALALNMRPSEFVMEIEQNIEQLTAQPSPLRGEGAPGGGG